MESKEEHTKILSNLLQESNMRIQNLESNLEMKIANQSKHRQSPRIINHAVDENQQP